MCPTLAVDDVVFVDKTAYLRAEPQVGDLVVYWPPTKSAYFIHRVVGVGGDELGFRADGTLVRNGWRFVVGDNRENSADSRHHGAVPTRHVLGRVSRLWLRGGRLVWVPVR